MPVYKDRDKWRVRIFHKGDHFDWIVDGSKKDAEAFEARKRVEMEQAGGFHETRVAPIFSVFCAEKYRHHAEAHLKARTWKNRQYTLATLNAFFGKDKLTEIVTARAAEYQQARLREKLQPSTINDEMKVLRAILNHAIYLGVPTCHLIVKDLPVRRRKRLAFWNVAQVQQLLQAVSLQAPSLYWLTIFLLETGCRKGEALALEFCDVDLERCAVRIQPNEEWQPKDNEAREIPLNKNGLLMSWLGDEATSKRRFVFVSRNKDDDGAPTPYAFWPQRKFDRARRAAGHSELCKDCSVEEGVTTACAKHGLVGGPHTTRHTFATHFLASVPDLYLLARLLGHSDARVTQLYAHLLPDHLERARGAVAFDAPVGVAEMKARMRWGEAE